MVPYSVRMYNENQALEQKIINQEAIIKDLNSNVAATDILVKKLDHENQELAGQNQELLQRIEEAERRAPVSRGSGHGIDLGVFEATAYGDDGDTVCADGHPAVPGVLAADPSVLPYGTKVYVEFDGAPEYNGQYVVHDCGSAVVNRIIDVYMESGWNEFGRRSCRVTLIE